MATLKQISAAIVKDGGARKAIAKKANSNGVVFALVTDGVTFEVWKLCENYDGKLRGGISKTWRYVEKGMAEEAALALFKRRASA